MAAVADDGIGTAQDVNLRAHAHYGTDVSQDAAPVLGAVDGVKAKAEGQAYAAVDSGLEAKAQAEAQVEGAADAAAEASMSAKASFLGTIQNNVEMFGSWVGSLFGALHADSQTDASAAADAATNAQGTAMDAVATGDVNLESTNHVALYVPPPPKPDLSFTAQVEASLTALLHIG